MSLNTELELQSLLSRMLAVETSVEEVTAAVGIDATKSSSALVVRDTVPFEVTLETASGTGPKAVNRVRVLLGSVYIGTTFGGSQVLTQDPAIVSGDVASAVDPADAGFWLTTANATAATDVWVEVNHLTLYWRLRIRVRVSATVPEWRAAGNVAWGAEGVSVFPLFSTGWSSTLASFDPFTVYQHRLGDIIIPATQYDGFDLEQADSPDGTFLNGGMFHIRGLIQQNVFLNLLVPSENDQSGSREFKNGLIAVDVELPSALEDGDNYIYVGLNGIHTSSTAVVTRTITPDAAVLHRRTGDPPGTWCEHHRVWKITVTSGYITAWEKYCSRVLLHDARFPDSGPGDASAVGPDVKSITFSTGASQRDDKGLISLYEFSAGPEFTEIDASQDWLLLRQNTGTNKAELKYVSVDTVAAAMSYGPTGGVAEALNDASSIYHYSLDFSVGDGATAAKALNEDHDLRYLYSKDKGTNTRDLYTTGEIDATKFALENAPTTNYWDTATGFKVTTDSTNPVDIYANGAIATFKGGTSTLVTSLNGPITLTSSGNIFLTPGSGSGIIVDLIHTGQTFTKTWTDHASVFHSLTFTQGICTAKT